MCIRDRRGGPRIARPFAADRNPGAVAVRGRDDLVATRLQLANQLRALLESFWPGAAAIFADIDSPIALAFLERYPMPESAARLGVKRLARFLAHENTFDEESLAIVELAKETQSGVQKHVAAYALGVLSSFWVLAAVIIAFKQSGEAVGWGFQFQNPAFVTVIAAVVWASALSLFGVFELPGLSIEVGEGHKGGVATSFSHGLLATLLRRPNKILSREQLLGERDVDPFDLPEWLGEADVTWTAETGLRSGHAVPGLSLIHISEPTRPY